MQVGDRVKFRFGGEEKEGEVVKIFPKKIFLKVDFPRHPGKIVVRSIAALEGKIPAPKKKKRKEKKEKEKEQRIQRPPQKKAEEEKE